MNIISIAVVFAFCPMLVVAQEPKKNDNTIIVKGVSFAKVKETLLDAGFFLDQQNSDDGTIITKRKGYCECPNKDFYQLVYYIRVKDSVATIRSQFSSEFSLSGNRNPKEDFSEVVYWKDKKSGYGYLFGIMIAFAESLKGSSIEYKRL